MIPFLKFIPIFSMNGGLSMFGLEKRTGRMLKIKSIVISVLMVLTSIILVQGSEKAYSVSSGDLVLHYDLNEGSGQNISDSSGNGWDATLGLDYEEGERDPEWSSGVNGTCLEFDGVEDLVMCNPFDMPEDEFTVAFWLKTGENDRRIYPFSYAVEGEDNELLIYMDDDITVEVDWPNEFHVDRDLRDNEWHHLAITWRSDNGTIDMYVDGILERSATTAEGETLEQNGSLMLGYEQDSVGGGFENEQGFAGSMDELIITGSYMNSTEIMDLFGEYNPPPSGLEILPGSQFLDLSWNSAEDPGLDFYNIYRVGPEDIGSGLRGFYYNNSNLTDLRFSRIDDQVNFDWGSDSPGGDIDDETFSVSWRGYLKLENDGQYDFYTTTDDGLRLWVDGDLIIDDWNNHASTERTAYKYLERGFHSIRLDYYDNSLTAAVKMEMDGPRSPRMIIPSDLLFSFNLTEMESIGTSASNNFRDSDLESGSPYFYHITYVDKDGFESGPSNVEGGTPSVPSTLILNPYESDGTVGQELKFDITIGNDARFKDWFELNVLEPYSDWVTLEGDEYYIEPGRRVHLDMYVSVPLNASEGAVQIQIEMISALNDVIQLASVWIDITKDPVIMNLKPYDGFRSGSKNMMISWDTAISSSTKAYLKRSDESSYTEYNGTEGNHHIVNISGLSRESEYEFYVESVSPYGSTQSDVRDFYVDNGVQFKVSLMDESIKRDYGQMVNVHVQNTDDKLHHVIVTVDNPHDDLIAGFVGSGSTDRSLPVMPGTTSVVKLALHAQDAKDIEHRLFLNLTTVPSDGDEPLKSYAVMKVRLDHVFVNLTLTEVSTDPYTLTKKIRIENTDDTVTDLRVYSQDRYSSYLNMEPSIQHGNLRSGHSIEIDISPQLTFSFIPFTSTIFVSAYDKTYHIDLDFSPPSGWDVFCASLFPNWGGFPFVEIPENDMDMDGLLDGEDDDIDGDGIPNSEEPSFTMDTDNDGFPNMIDPDDDGDGNPDISDPWRIDFDNDWIPNYIDPDRDGDGIDNTNDTYPDDLDNDGINNGRDLDDDNDRIKDSDDYHPQDHDNDGENDDEDSDDDNDLIPDVSDTYPYDQDNDGNPDVNDGDWKGGGEASPKSNKWNPNPAPGGSPGNFGGGGGSDSSGGSDWYCTNKPELDLAELLLFLFDLGMILFGLVTGILAASATAACMWGLIGIIGGFIKDQAMDAAWGSFEDMTGFNWAATRKSFVQSGLDFFGLSRGTKNSGPTRGIDDVLKYYNLAETDTSDYPVTLVNTNGIHYFWQEEVDSVVQIHYATSQEITRQPVEEILLTNTSTDSVDPSVISDPYGRIYLVYAENGPYSSRLMVKWTDTDGNWDESVEVASSTGNIHQPQMMKDSRGRSHLVWMDSRYGNYEIMHSYSDSLYHDHPHIETPKRLTDTLSVSAQPEIGIGGNNDVHVVWSDGSGASREIYHIMSDDRGESWGSNYQVSNSGNGTGEPALALTEQNVVHVVWKDSRHGESELYYRKGPDSASSWGEEERLTDDTSYSEFPVLNIYKENLILTWHDDRTNVDLLYFKTYNSTEGEWSLTKRVPAGIPTLDSLFFELELTPKDSSGEVKPHDFYLMLDDIVIGSVINQVPDGKYLFEIPMDVLSAASAARSTGKLKLVTKHMNPGHYTVAANWKLMWHFTYDNTYVCAPDQYTADMYLRENLSDRWLTEDPAIYANDISLSDSMPDLNDTIQITATVRNQGGDAAQDVEVRFYEQEPGNSSRQIGDTLIIESLAPHGNESVTVQWTASSNASRIYVVVDEDEKINELVETNNVEYIRVTVLREEPPKCMISINGGNLYTHRDYVIISIETDSANEVSHYSLSNDNVTWSDWMWINTHVSWYLEEDTRSDTIDEDQRTIYCKVMDMAGLQSEVISAKIGYYPDDPVVLNSSLNEGIVDVNESISIEFNNPMDDISTRTSVILEPSLDGSFFWENYTLFFKPMDGWEPDLIYNITILDTAMDFAGRKIDREYNWSFIAIEEGPGDDDDDDYTDTDGDGMPDEWEDLHGLNKTDPSDASGDLDGDGRTNLEEYIDGTDPEIIDEPADDDDDEGEDDDDGIGGLLICAIPVMIVIILIAVIVVVVFIKRGGKSEIEE